MLFFECTQPISGALDKTKHNHPIKQSPRRSNLTSAGTNGAVTFTERLVQCEEEGEGLTSPVLVHLREYHSVSVLSVRVRTGA